MATTTRKSAREQANDIAAAKRFRESFEGRLREVCEAFPQFYPPQTAEEIAMREKVVAELIAVENAMTQYEINEEMEYQQMLAESHERELEYADDNRDHEGKGGGHRDDWD